MDPSDYIHISLQEDIEIEPTELIPQLSLLESTLGPFKKDTPVFVPLFIALSLRKSNLCTIRTPVFLEKEYLEVLIDHERVEKDSYGSIYPFLFESYRIICDSVYNMKERDLIKSMVNELKEIRLKKTLEGLQFIDGKAMNLNNMTGFEFGQIRTYMLEVMEMSNKL